MNEETTRDILACRDRDDLEKLLCKYKEKSLNARMKCDRKFATSPIFIDDKDYEFSVDPELITLVESDRFHGYETETVVAHLTKLNDISTLFTHDEKTSYYFILKLFPFSLKGDCRCQNRQILGRGSRTVRLGSMVTGGRGHDVYPGSGPLDGAKTLRPA